MKTSETAKLFLSKDNFLLLTHKNPDGDTLGSASALCSALRRAGKTAYLFPNREITKKYKPFAEPFFAPKGYQAAYTVAVDIAAEKLFPLGFEGKADFCIDHHPSNTKYTKQSLIAPSKASCGEIVMQLIIFQFLKHFQMVCKFNFKLFDEMINDNIPLITKFVGVNCV